MTTDSYDLRCIYALFEAVILKEMITFSAVMRKHKACLRLRMPAAYAAAVTHVPVREQKIRPSSEICRTAFLQSCRIG